jgi:hypothetical protein
MSMNAPVYSLEIFSMSADRQFDVRLNRRQLLQLGGAACACGLRTPASFAQERAQRMVCIQVEPGDAASLGKNPEAAKLSRAQSFQRSAQNILDVHGITNRSSVLSSPTRGTSAQHPIFQSLPFTSRQDAPTTLQKAVAGQSLAPAERAIMNQLKYWPQQSRVTYAFVTSDRVTGFGLSLRQMVKDVFDEWHQYCCLDFVPAASGQESTADIRISFTRAGHYSLVGTDSRVIANSPNNSGRFESLNLDPTDGGFVSDRDWTISRARHEIGHAIGFCHEQSNPDHRIRWNEAVVKRVLQRDQGWTDEAIRQNVFNVLDDPREFVHTSRDPKSIMFYSFPRECILDDGGVSVPDMEHPNLVISQVDIDFCRQKYGCAGTDDPQKKDHSTDDKPEKKTAIQTDRQKLKAAGAVSLKIDSPFKGEFNSDAQMVLYKFVGVAGDYVIETIDGAKVGVALNGTMPVVIELYDGTDFSEDKSIAVSTFGAFNSNDSRLSSLGSQDAFLPCKLLQGTTYYVLVRPQQRLKGDSKGAYNLLFRKAATEREIKDSWTDLRDQISKSQTEIQKFQSETAGLLKKLRK